MSFVSNTDAGTVSHVTNEFYKKFIANDYIIDSADTGGNLPSGGTNGASYRQPLKFALGKYERVIGRLVAFFIADADCDLKWKTTVPTAATGSKFYGTFQISTLPATSGGTDVIHDDFANLVDGSAVGFAEETITGSSDGLITVKQDFVYVNAGTAGVVAVNVAQNTSHSSDLVLKAGSYLQYMKF